MERYETRERTTKIDLQVLWDQLVSKWWFLLLLTLLAGGAAYYATTEVIAPKYTAQSMLYVGRSSPNDSSPISEQVSMDPVLMPDYLELLNTRWISEQVISTLDLDLEPDKLRELVRIQSVKDSRFMTITYKDTDASMAAKIVNGYSNILMDQAESVVGVKNIQIVDYALAPAHPSEPHIVRDTGIVALLGFLIAVLLILMRMVLKNRILSEEEAKSLLQLPILGVVPQSNDRFGRKEGARLVTLDAPNSTMAEGYRLFVTNLTVVMAERSGKVLLFTSPEAGEPRPAAIANAALAFASTGKKVLLIECDLRKPGVQPFFQTQKEHGLGNILRQMMDWRDVVQKVKEVPNVDLIAAGTMQEDPYEILSGKEMERLILETREAYDVILLDAPPVLAAADASIICRLADGVLLVITLHRTGRGKAKQALEMLKQAGAALWGTLLFHKAGRRGRNSFYGKKRS